MVKAFMFNVSYSLKRKNTYSWAAIFFGVFLLLLPLLRIFVDISFSSSIISLTSGALMLFIMFLYSTLGDMAKNNTVRIFEGLGFKPSTVFISGLLVCLICSLPALIVLVICDGVLGLFITIFFLSIIFLFSQVSFLIISRSRKSIKATVFLFVGLVFPLTTSMSLYEKEFLRDWSFIQWFEFPQPWLSCLLLFLMVILIAYFGHSKNQKINKINWTKWCK